MPVAATAPSSLTPLELPERKKFTRDECDFLEREGLLDPERYELIEGDVLFKVSKNRPHVITATLLNLWLGKTFGRRMATEAPVDVADQDNPTSRPEPDFVILKCSQLELRDRNPRPEEIALAVEISDSTLAFDLRIKAGLYARAGIVEYWVADVAGGRMIVHREPVDGRYRNVAVYSGDERLAPLESPEDAVRLSDVFPA